MFPYTEADPFEIGDVVQLKSGGLYFTVVGIVKNIIDGDEDILGTTIDIVSASPEQGFIFKNNCPVMAFLCLRRP
jgi:hypothetical protein